MSNCFILLSRRKQINVPAEPKRGFTMRRISRSLLITCLFLAACSRTASINPLPSLTAGTTLAATLAPTLSATVEPTLTPVLQPIATLELSSLPAQLPDSAKGYELYSWQMGDHWNFTLITGTNRTKALEEITTPGNSVGSDGFVKISVASVDDLKQVLGRLPKGESILWGGIDLGGEVPADTAYLTFPPQTLMDEVAAYCTSLGLKLTSLKQ
jgi:hypothetical protein